MYVCPECGTSAPGAGACPRDGHALAPSDDAVIGQVLGNYRIARLIGAGGMGRVYLGVQPQIGSRVAIKVLSEECAKDRGLVERFFTEARAVNVIRHESIVNVLDINQLPDGRPYIVMELLEGESLADMIRRGPIPLPTLQGYVAQVLHGLAAAHDKGIIHRDLKPDNVFITPSGRAKILDFGIAKLVPELGAVAEGTRTGALIGTPFYMAPEQALARPVDARSDLYSVGIILYEAVTGRRPFTGSTLYELLKQHVELDPPPPSSLRYDLAPGLEAVIRKAMAKSPSHRFQNAQEFAHALETSGQGLSLDMPPAASYGAPSYASAPAHTPAAPPWSANVPSQGYVPSPLPGTPPNLNAPPPGYAQPHSHVPAMAPAPQAARSNLPLLAAAGCGGLLLLGLVLGGVAVFMAKQGAASAAATTRSDTESTIAADQPTAQPTITSGAVKATSTELNFNAKSFDVTAFQSEAETIAHRHLPDAVMVAVDLMGVDSKGIINFEVQSSSQALYRFRSPARSKPPADFPKNAAFESNCMVYVMVQKTGVNSFVLDKWACDMPLTGKPACSAKQIWQKAAKQGAPIDNVIGNIGFNGQMAQNNKLRWYVSIPPNFSAVIPDDC